MPISTQSVTVMTVVPRSRPTFTPGRGACQPPMPIWTRFLAGTFGMSVAWNHGVVCIRSSRSVSWVSTWRSKWMIPRLPPLEMGATSTRGRVPDRLVAAEHDWEGAARV